MTPKQREDWSFSAGQRVVKPKGYPFPGVVEAAFITLDGEERYVVNFVDKDGLGSPTGMLHIFAPTQLLGDDRFDRDGALVVAHPTKGDERE